MTILCRIEKPGLELTVCGTPSKQWLDWLLTATVPLTASQIGWRELHREQLHRETCAGAGGAVSEPASYVPPVRRTPKRFDLIDTEEL